MTRGIPSLARVNLRAQGLRDDVARHLLRAIIAGEIASGERLAAQSLAQRLGVSATPVREALVELASIVLVQITNNRGAVSTPFGPRELKEMYELRRVLEVEATHLACGQIDAEHLRSMRLEMAKLAERKTADWSARAIELDTQFHGLIQDHCGSKRLQHELNRYQSLIAAIREVVGDQFRVQVRAVEEHIEIIDALLDGDADAACAAMRRHIEQTAKGVERALF